MCRIKSNREPLSAKYVHPRPEFFFDEQWTPTRRTALVTFDPRTRTQKWVVRLLVEIFRTSPILQNLNYQFWVLLAMAIVSRICYCIVAAPPDMFMKELPVSTFYAMLLILTLGGILILAKIATWSPSFPTPPPPLVRRQVEEEKKDTGILDKLFQLPLVHQMLLVSGVILGLAFAKLIYCIHQADPTAMNLWNMWAGPIYYGFLVFLASAGVLLMRQLLRGRKMEGAKL